MILVCPNCSTRYRIRDDALGASGRKVRCRSCGHHWQASDDRAADVDRAAEVPAEPAPATAVEAEVPPAPAPSSPPAPAEPVRVADAEAPLPPGRVARGGNRERTAGIVAWAGLAVLLLALAGLYAGRARVTELAPWTEPVYRGFGLAVGQGSGLELRDHSASRREVAGRSVLLISGQIANIAADPRTVPRIRVALLDGAGNEVAIGLFDAVEPLLAPGALTTFTAEMPDTPADASSYRVAFAD